MRRTAAVVVSWEGGEATRRCVHSLLAQDRPPAEVIVVDNASGEAERAALEWALRDLTRVRLLPLAENRQFAGGLNAGARAAFEEGAARVLLLNNDTVLEPEALRHLEDAMDAIPEAGIVGPCVRDLERRGALLSCGERHAPSLLCFPRTLLRYRRTTTRPYRVSGVMGCALLVSRACFEAVGGFAEEIGVYYEDVDFCLSAAAAGFAAVIEPRAIVWHQGMRGFARGLTPWAAYRKARNPWLVLRRHGGLVAWCTFVPTYSALIAASVALWGVRGEREIVRGLCRGAWAGLTARQGNPAQAVCAPRAGG